MMDLVLPGGLMPDPARIWHVAPLHSQGRWPVKGCPDALDYGVDFSPFLAAAGDTIKMHTVTVLTATGSTYDLTLAWNAHDKTRVLMMLGSGSPVTMKGIMLYSLRLGQLRHGCPQSGRLLRIPVTLLAQSAVADQPDATAGIATLSFDHNLMIGGLEILGM